MSMLPDYDVAVIGGGVGGIYTAWRMLTTDLASSPELSAWAKARPDGRLKVAVFEGSGRIGGRLLSAVPPDMPHVVTEIGGMRYMTSQTLVRSLIENELKLPRHEQVGPDEPQNLAYLRGARLRTTDLAKPETLPYDLTEAESDAVRTQQASGLIPWAIEQILPGVSSLTGDELSLYLQSAKVDGVPLYAQGFWNIVSRALSSEGYQLSRTTVGYDGLGWNANAVDMTTEYFDFTPGVKYYLLDGGYDMVPWTLERRFREAGGDVRLGAWLDGFDGATLPDGTAGVALRFQAMGAAVTAHAVVLAMPRRAIELLRPEGPVLDPARAPHFQEMLQAVEPLPLYKMFICYPYPWWETVGVTEGRSLTDIPLRQIYYWAVEGQQRGANPTNTNAALMVYNDAESVSYWGGLRPIALGPGDTRETATPGIAAFAPGDAKRTATPRRAGGRVPAPHGGPPFVGMRRPPVRTEVPGDPYMERLRKNWDDHVAPAAMVAAMHRQLMELHGLLYAPEPFEAAFMDWSDDPDGGGVHFWNPGHKSWEVLFEMTKPVRDFPCYVCGEAWSTNQTWVEGALQTSEIVLQQRFGLPPPAWVTG